VWRDVRRLIVGLTGCALAAIPLSAGRPPRSQAQPLPATPSITRIAPNNGAGAGGTVVTITGRGFGRGARVRFGSAAASAVSVRSSTAITATGPAGAGTVDITVAGPRSTSPRTPYDRFAYDPPPSGSWLGLNGNSANYLGPVGQFVADHIVYDRDEYGAGELPSRNDPLHRAISHHMIPDVVIEYAGYTGEGFGRLDPSFPTGGEAIVRYVRGFIRTARAILHEYPRRRILFEPINEPYGYARPAQYAAVIAQLLPAARRAGVPLDAIYVAAYGKGWVPAMYAAAPALRTLIQGWYFHPYGPPAGEAGEYAAGIQSLPYVQAEMTSGQSNIIVSEIGWCAEDVNHGSACTEPRVSSARDAARLLTEGLSNALPMRRAGWLRALLIFSRNDGGWAMELPKAILTEPGRALIRFARAHPNG
jgi:hypothetical protein